jgi:glycosyltransferase involved in cell wall biosynthesis
VEREKILVVGPVGPTRGGIARHTERVIVELLKHIDCDVYSDSKLFPNHLYPGEFQEASWLSTPEAPGLKVIRKRFPKLLLELMRADSRSFVGALVIWWTAPLAPKFILTLIVLRMLGIKSVAFCHNVEPRSNSLPAKLMTISSLSMVSSLIVQSKRDAKFLEANLGKTREISVIGHPAYNPSRASKNIQNESNSIIRFLFFGHLRKYKGLEILLDAAKLISDTSVEIRIVGESWSQELTMAVFTTSQMLPETLSHRMEFVTDDEAEDELARADVIVLPYLSATGSGVLAQAIGLNKPVIVSDIPELRDQVRPGIDGWFFQKGNSVDLAQTIQDAANSLRATTLQPWEGNDSIASWEKVSVEILRMLDSRH